jgi:tetratricopeptide (TPR) repeat protein
MRVAIYAICRDEAAFASAFAEAGREADCIVVADTGSTDGCQDRLRQAGVTVQQILVDPWRFDDARNAALALVPDDIDVCFSLDMDEQLSPGWRKVLEAGWSPGTTRAFYTFVASHEADGRDGVVFLNSRLHARHGYRWRHACHEGLYPDRIEERFVTLPDIRVDHWPDRTKSRAAYADLLAVAVREEPDDARMAHYYARELYYLGRYDEAVAEFTRYLSMPSSNAEAERAASCLFMARCLDASGRAAEAERWRWRAASECPHMREVWVDLAEAAYKTAEWSACHSAATRALSLNDPFTGYMTEPHAWGFTPHDLAAISAWRLGLHAEALGHAGRALALAPDDARLQSNLDFIAASLTGSGKSS